MGTKTVIANMTIEAGSPKKPVTIEKGESFEIDADDPEDLIGRGIVVDPDAEVAPEPAGPSVEHAA